MKTEGANLIEKGESDDEDLDPDDNEEEYTIVEPPDIIHPDYNLQYAFKRLKDGRVEKKEALLQSHANGQADHGNTIPVSDLVDHGHTISEQATTDQCDHGNTIPGSAPNVHGNANAEMYMQQTKKATHDCPISTPQQSLS